MRGAGLVAASVALSGCSGGVTAPAGPIGAQNLTILVDSLAIMLAIVVPTIVATIGFAWWFRESNPRARRLPDWEFSGSIELVVWAVPLLTILLLGGVTWIGSHALDPYRPVDGRGEPLEIQVVSLDWKWLFIYPAQGVASVNALAVPVGRPLHFTLTSSSVMNAFFVPRLGSMIDTMNGMATQLWLRADEPGRYRGLSAHFSGQGFSDMGFALDAMPPDGFDAWIAARRGNGPRLDEGAYAALAEQGSRPAVTGYREVAHGLFDRILTGGIAPGPGPAVEGRGARQAPESDVTGR